MELVAASASKRKDTRTGSYDSLLHIKAGTVELTKHNLRQQKFETDMIQRFRRRERSIEVVLAETCLAGVSVRRVEDFTETL